MSKQDLQRIADIYGGMWRGAAELGTGPEHLYRFARGRTGSAADAATLLRLVGAGTLFQPVFEEAASLQPGRGF